MFEAQYFVHEYNAWLTFARKVLVAAVFSSYVVSILFLTLYAVFYVSNFVAYLRRGASAEKPSGEGETGRLPMVAVVYPVYNDYEILASIRKASRMEYENYILVIADDSDDERLAAEVSRLGRRLMGDRFVHLRRGDRRGLKAGALNNAIGFVMQHYPEVEYFLFLDADFEPEPRLLNKLVTLALESGSDVVQGYQRHLKGSDSPFGLAYRASQGGAIVNMVGRSETSMFPIFTGSCALIRADVLRRVGFLEGSLSEDWRWTIDAVVATRGRLKVVATSEARADGSVPRSFRAFVKQQIRWSAGTLIEFQRTLAGVLGAGFLGFWDKLGYTLQGLFFTQWLWILLNLLAPALLTLLAPEASLFRELGLLWPIGVYVWLTGFEAAILSGALVEGYGWRKSFQAALVSLLLVYVTSVIHAWGTLKAVFGSGPSWVVTSKRGEYEDLYKE